MRQVLILESNEDYARELAEYFHGKKEYEVCGISGDGQEGIELLEKESPAVCIVSLMLQRKDGFAVLEEGRKRGGKTEFVVLGNYSDDRIINRAISMGARYYFMKPISAEIVGKRIEELYEGEMVREGIERKRGGSIEERITNIFISIGIPPHIKGYAYLREGIKMAVNEPKVINNVTKGLYPVIGEKYGTSASKVERAIRHAIEVAWNRGRTEAVNAIFGARVYIGTERPTNSEFIALVADKLLLEGL